MDNENQTPDIDVKNVENAHPVESKNNKWVIIGISIGVIVILGSLIAFAYFLLTGESGTTEKIRDVFIIFMALESMVIGLVLIILVIQLAQLTNLFQNEVKPILDSTQETVSTLRGTAKFLSDNLVEPVIKLNQYLAGLQTITKFVLPASKGKKKNKQRRNDHGKRQ